MTDPLLYDLQSPIVGALVLVMYVAFTLLALMNVVTGVFVESALLRAKEDKELYVMTKAHDLFRRLGLDGDISWCDLEALLDNKDMQDFFHTIGVEISEARGLFTLLDQHDRHVVNSDDFLRHCLRLRGGAKSLDLLLLARETRRAFRKHAVNLRNFDSRLCGIAEAVRDVRVTVTQVAASDVLRSKRAFYGQSRFDSKQQPDLQQSAASVSKSEAIQADSDFAKQYNLRQAGARQNQVLTQPVSEHNQHLRWPVDPPPPQPTDCASLPYNHGLLQQPLQFVLLPPRPELPHQPWPPDYQQDQAFGQWHRQRYDRAALPPSQMIASPYYGGPVSIPAPFCSACKDTLLPTALLPPTAENEIPPG